MPLFPLDSPHDQLVAGLVVGAVFVATLVRSTFGFGEALVAVPLLAFVIDVEVAVPLATLFSVVIAAIILAQDWRHVHLRSAWSLLIPTLFGIPLGLWGLKTLPEVVIKSLLAAVIITFSSYCLFNRHKLHLRDERWAWAFGFVAGILGGAYGMNGPPLVVYGTLRGWTPERFRATLQGYFFPASLLGLCGYAATGLWVPAVTGYFLLAFPSAVAAILIGRAVNRRMHMATFARYVYVGLIAIGIVLVAGSK
jgi:uncharacterized membrane protein YfcA